MGTGADGEVLAIGISGSDVYVGGGFTSVGGVSNTSRIARWDGSSWNSLPGSNNETVSVLAVDGSQVYVGRSSILTVLRPAIVSNVTDISAISDGLNNIQLLYSTTTGAVMTRLFSAGSWSAATTLTSSGGVTPVLSYDSVYDDLFAYWNEAGALKYKRFTGSWDSSATTVQASGVRYPACDGVSGGGKIKFLWTSGNSSPFTISTGVVEP